MSESSASRDRLASLVMRRVKRSASSTTGFNSMSGDDTDLKQCIKDQLDHKQRCSTVVSQLSSNGGMGFGRNGSAPLHSGSGDAASIIRSNASTPVSHSNMFGRPKSEVKFKEINQSIKHLQSPPRLKVAATPHIPIRGNKDELVDDLWGIMAKQKDNELIDIKAKAKAVHNAKLTQQKQILDAQCAIRTNRKKAERQAHLAERSVIDGQKLQWDQERRDVSDQLKGVAVRIKGDREEQVADREVRKVQREDERKDIDRRILERMREELDEEEERAKALKARAVIHREDLIAANEAQKQIRRERKVDEDAMEQVYARQFREQVEKTERQRAKALEELKDKMRGKEVMAMKLQATIEQKAVEDEKKADLVTEARYQQKIKREEEEKEKKRESINLVLEFRKKQLEIKAQRRAEEKIAQHQEKLDAETEVRESVAVLKARKAAQREKISNFKVMITDQLKDNQEFHPVRMSEEERNINKGILYRAKTESPKNYRSV